MEQEVNGEDVVVQSDASLPPNEDAREGDVPSSQEGAVPSSQEGAVPSSQEGAVPSSQEGAVRAQRVTAIGALNTVGDGIAVREGYAVTLDMFEGPLDLLLHLVRRHELDVLDIPISFVTEKYVEYLEFARSVDIEVAGEYLVMAATLAYLKSRELLPPDPTEDADDPLLDPNVDSRTELIARLVEYERFRSAGEDLGNRPVIGRDVFGRGGDLDVTPPAPDLAPVTLFRLADAYHRVLERARISQSHDVEIEPVTVRQRMQQLSLILQQESRVDFEELFLSRTWSSPRELRQMLVVTLMSVLELVKLGVLGLHQADGSESIILERTGDAEALSSAAETFEEDHTPQG